ncbi:MAG: hypothetical protein P8X60_07310 [Robiginitalea sp.]|jgi:hypothetical protein
MKKYLLLLCAVLLFAQCKSEQEDPFLIGKDRVGKLLQTHRLTDLDVVYQSDSLVRDTSNLNMGRNGKIEVYEKGGSHLLTLTPSADSIPGIENIQIRDPRFTTAEGIHLNSTFGDIEKAYEIRKVMGSLNNIVILLKDHPLYVTISREELPAALRYGGTDIEPVQIPEKAGIKYIMVAWE